MVDDHSGTHHSLIRRSSTVRLVLVLILMLVLMSPPEQKAHGLGCEGADVLRVVVPQSRRGPQHRPQVHAQRPSQVLEQQGHAREDVLEQLRLPISACGDATLSEHPA